MIPFIDLKSQYNQIQSDIEEAVLGTLRSGQYILGPVVEKFENKLSSYLSTKEHHAHCVSCSSGTDALLMALMAKNIGSNSVIFTTPFTFIATAEVIARLGATPVFVDLDPNTYNLDPAQLELAIAAVVQKNDKIYPIPKSLLKASNTAKPAGIIAVDLFGLPCDYQKINHIARQHDLFVIQDAAQSFGATYFEQKAGTHSELACTSFYPPKPLGCYGDGGAMFCRDETLAEKLRSLRVHGGNSHAYRHIQLGLTGRLDAIQASILIKKLDIFDKELKKRQQIATQYQEALTELEEIQLPVPPKGYKSAWALYSVVAKTQYLRNKIQSHLKQNKIPSVVYYPTPLHLQPVFAYLEYQKGHFPISEMLSERILSIPMHPYLTHSMIEKITQTIKSTLQISFEVA